MASTVRTDKVGPVSGSADFILPTADGTVGQFLKTDGSLALGFATVATTGFHQEVIYTTSSAAGGYSPDTGVTKIVVEIVGGGGAGSRYTSDGPKVNGGAGAGYVRKTLTVTDTDTMTVTIGAGGTHNGNTNTAGTAGGDSTFASVTGASFSILTSGGGGLGSITNYTPGVPGTATNGDLNIAGETGHTQNMGTSNGGDSWFGWGGLARSQETTSMGPNAGQGYGAGGGGGADNGTAGAGAAGICIITEYK